MSNRLGNSNKILSHYSNYYIEAKKFKNVQHQTNQGGVPLAYDRENKRIAVDSEDTHTLVFGATGSMKSRAVVKPSVKILGVAGESMIISDPKAEIYTRMAGELKARGYDVLVINLREPAVGNAWNPLYIPYKLYKEGDIDRATEFVNDISANLMLSDVSEKDPFWDNSAADMMFGLVLLLFKYCKDHQAPDSAVNIGNLLRLKRLIYNRERKPRTNSLWRHYASQDELIEASLSGSVNAPNDTRDSILSVFDQKMRIFSIQPTLVEMLSNNDIEIADIGRKKTAVFIIMPDEKTTFHKLVSLFIKQSYEYIIYEAMMHENYKVSNRINYLLDEFSSLPAINDFPAMISAARSRDIRFTLVVQSRHQLIKRYKEEAETIISNCSNWIFLTSRELSLLRELSELCGLNRNNKPNISVYELQHLNKKNIEALVLCGRLEPAVVNLLDIDRYGDKNHILVSYKTMTREKRHLLDFELHDEETPESDDDMSKLIERIDKKIAMLEAEEAEEKKRRGNDE